MHIPPSPPARRLRPPTWFDLRLLAGALLVVGSTAAGTVVVSAADRSVEVWALARDVAAGTVLAEDDVRPVRVRLFDSAPGYLDAARTPAGRSVARALSSGELLPASVLEVSRPGLVVNLPVRPENAPSVTRGQAVDVWAGTKDCHPRRILASAAVQEVRTDGVGTLSTGTSVLQVMLRVGPTDADRLLTVLSVESVVRLVVVDGPAPQRAVAAAPCGRAG